MFARVGKVSDTPAVSLPPVSPFASAIIHHSDASPHTALAMLCSVSPCCTMYVLGAALNAGAVIGSMTLLNDSLKRSLLPM